MRLTIKYPRGGSSFYQGRKNNFVFSLRQSRKNDRWHFTCRHKSLDIRYNSLWGEKTFSSLEECEQACESFSPDQADCLGADFCPPPKNRAMGNGLKPDHFCHSEN